jgi:hypothetical protein
LKAGRLGRVGNTESAVSFDGALPIPDVNVALYRRIYVLEQWLRRIALAGLMARYGSRWNDSISNDMMRNVKPRLENLKNRVAFNTENSDNLVWCLTLEELGRLLLSDQTWVAIKALTGFHRDELRERVNDLREIRNVIGHNRAATQYTMDVFAAIERNLDQGIAPFRDRMLYDLGGAQVSPSVADQVVDLFFRDRSALGRDQITQDEYFYYAHMIENAARPLDLGALLERFEGSRRAVLAFLVNREELGEFAVVWPKSAAGNEHEAIIDLLGGHPLPSGADYAAQSPRYTCHPKVWFVETSPRNHQP